MKFISQLHCCSLHSTSSRYHHKRKQSCCFLHWWDLYTTALNAQIHVPCNTQQQGCTASCLECAGLHRVQSDAASAAPSAPNWIGGSQHRNTYGHKQQTNHRVVFPLSVHAHDTPQSHQSGYRCTHCYSCRAHACGPATAVHTTEVGLPCNTANTNDSYNHSCCCAVLQSVLGQHNCPQSTSGASQTMRRSHATERTAAAAAAATIQRDAK